MEHTMKTVGNICNNMKSLEEVLQDLTSISHSNNSLEIESAMNSLKATMHYIYKMVDDDKELSKMCVMYKDSLDRGLSEIDISGNDLSAHEIVALFAEFNVRSFTMSMNNKYTIYNANVFFEAGYRLREVYKLQDGKMAIHFQYE